MHDANVTSGPFQRAGSGGGVDPGRVEAVEALTSHQVGRAAALDLDGTWSSDPVCDEVHPAMDFIHHFDAVKKVPY
jgi:hypothetical protein